MEEEGRILHHNWDLYDTRHVVYKTEGLSAKDLQKGYNEAYKSFYAWSNIFRASLQHDNIKHMVKHFTYAGGWKKFEPLWNFLIKTGSLNKMLPLLEGVLSKIKSEEKRNNNMPSPFPAIA